MREDPRGLERVEKEKGRHREGDEGDEEFICHVALLRLRRIESASRSRGVDDAGGEQENADHQTRPGQDSGGQHRDDDCCGEADRKPQLLGRRAHPLIIGRAVEALEG